MFPTSSPNVEINLNPPKDYLPPAIYLEFWSLKEILSWASTFKLEQQFVSWMNANAHVYREVELLLCFVFFCCVLFGNESNLALSTKLNLPFLFSFNDLNGNLLLSSRKFFLWRTSSWFLTSTLGQISPYGKLHLDFNFLLKSANTYLKFPLSSLANLLLIWGIFQSIILSQIFSSLPWVDFVRGWGISIMQRVQTSHQLVRISSYWSKLHGETRILLRFLGRLGMHSRNFLIRKADFAWEQGFFTIIMRWTWARIKNFLLPWRELHHN